MNLNSPGTETSLARVVGAVPWLMAEFSGSAPGSVQFGGALVCKTTITFTNIFLTMGKRRENVKSVYGTQMTTGLTISKRCHGSCTGPGRVAAGSPLTNEERGGYVFDHACIMHFTSIWILFSFSIFLRNNMKSKHIVFFPTSLLCPPNLPFF